MSSNSRRNFLKYAGLSILPTTLPVSDLFAGSGLKHDPPGDLARVDLFGDGKMYDPAAYIELLQQINRTTPIEPDRYGNGGAVALLEKRFAEITGKEKAMVMPSGTMANQLAISVLSGENTKVYVQDLSHVYRDEADAAQSLFNKRLMPLAMGKAFFSADEFKQAVESLGELEVFKSGIGAVSIENPVRRADGRMVPLEEIRKISEYCRSNKIKLHLDGARIYMSSAWSGVSVREYAAYFDTIYISLYKYLGASGGAVLCGDAAVMDKMPHLIKIHGGNMFGNWANAAMALHRLEGLEDRMKAVVKRSGELMAELNKIPGISIAAIEGGTNIHSLQLGKEVDGKKLQATLRKDFLIRMPMPDKNNHGFITFNESILDREPGMIVEAFRRSVG
ncbi:MAG: aminotransferase class I/II-fold pyridoxal phosphate-dependent enzyme [Chitinophagaceae bacterium]|nr:aminotransferase class I/II-fold pyridoxal phosphate-dependent enzyme [Chitinophagaceae bacterium]